MANTNPILNQNHENASNVNESFETALINELFRGRSRPPKLVLSIIGDSSSFVPKPWLIPVLKTGIIATAKGAKDYLILYKGSTERISSIVKEAIDDLWYLREDEKADNVPEDNKFKVNLKSVIQLKRALGKKTIFAMFHAQTMKIIAEKEIKFMTLEENKALIWRLPVLTVVAEGDLYTVDAIVQVLKSDLPVLLLKGSGKAADFVAGFIEEYGNDSSDSSIEKYIKEKSAILFGIVSPKDKSLNKLKAGLKCIHEYKFLITILDINKDTKPSHFTDSVTTSIIRGWSHISRDGLSNGGRFNSTDSSESKGTEEDPDITQPCESNRKLPTLTNGIRNNVVKKKTLHNSIPVTENSLQISTINTGTFMEKYQATLSPASLPLFYYIAYQTIQDMEKRNKTQNFKILLKEAIIADRHEYVSVLLEEHKVRIGFNQVSDIYQKTLLCNGMAAAKTDFQGVFKWASKRAVETLQKAYKLKKGEYDLKCIDEIIGILNKIIVDTPPTEIFSKKEREFRENWKILTNEKHKETISDELSIITVLTSKMCILASRNICQSLLEYPKSTTIDWESNSSYEDLLLWAILENRPNLASIFWMKSRNQLLCALLASCLYSKMAYKVKSTKDQSRYDDMRKQARIYEERSVYLQSKLYEENAALAMELVVTEFSVWDITISPLECAHENMMLDFISQSCCQRRLNKIWYNDIGGSLKGVLKKGLLNGCCFCFDTDNEHDESKLRKFVCSPLARFGLHYAFFFAALVCYSAFLLTELDFIDGLQSVGPYEWIVYIHLLGDVLEQYRHVDLKEPKFPTDLTDIYESKTLLKHSWLYRVKSYLYNFWNILDVISYILTVTAMLVRFFKPTTTNNLTRRFYSLGLFTMYMRFLHIILVERKLGPKIIMIKEMVKELLRFIGILLIFMMGVGVLYHANMYPKHEDMWNSAGWTYWRIWKIMYIPYWQIYGFNFLDSFDANSTTPCTTIQSEWESNPDIERCNRYDWVLIVIAAFYMLISNLLLVNLVIALFSFRFRRVQENSGKLWRYLRYEVIMDYRTIIPAPLNLIIRPILSCMSIYRKLRRCRHGNDVHNQKTDQEKKRKDESLRKNKRNKIKTLQSVHAVNCVLEI
ncbi:transient receptor potential cation channel subfamily M member 1-like [Mytilus edulis]|uniref:transient receptor potential cation channel subfamily M member 1-like n=1 Tax=Mytilus edulis TaxID=6550 RepID=UPI0039EFD393